MRSKYFGPSDNSALTEVDSFGILNLRFGLRGEIHEKQWSVALWANNALDKDYTVSLSRGTSGEYLGSPGLPRSIGATLRVDF